MTGQRTRAARVFHLVLRLLPREFRGDFGEEMEADFADHQRDAVHRGRAFTVHLWIHTLPSLLRVAIAEHAAAFIHDARFALRMMARTPGFTAAALVMIALGTGANAAMFSVVDAVMLRSPFRDPDRLAIVRVEAPGRRATAAISPAQYSALKEHATSFDGVAALGGSRGPILTSGGDARRIVVECVTADMFTVLGASPLIGRTFAAEEDRPGAAAVMILSYEFWQREFGGALDAVSRPLTLDGISTTVIGVMPPRFGGPLSRNRNDGWLPLGPALGGQPGPGCVAGSINLFARLKQSESFASAAERATVSAGIPRIPGWGGEMGDRVTLLSIADQTVDELRRPFLALLGAVACVLLIASSNIANLQLARVFARRRELALRMAMGATRGRIVRQTLTEHLVLFAGGAAAGLMAARWSLRLIVGLLPLSMPHLHDIELNGRVLAATIGIAATAALAVGLVPALQAINPSLIDDLRVSTPAGSRRGTWIRRTLVVAQLTLSLTLAIGAVLMILFWTFLTLRPVRPGFDAMNKLTAVVSLRGAAARAPAVFFHRFLDKVRDLPGVQAASGSTYLPMSGVVTQVTSRAGEASVSVWTGAVTPNYFVEMGIPFLRGRGFGDGDDARAAPVAIVNEALVHRAWPHGDPLGETISLPTRDGPPAIRQVIGVVRDTRSLGGTLTSHPEVYVPIAQDPSAFLNAIIRTADPRDARLPGEVRAAAAAVDPTQVVERFTPLEVMLTQTVSTPRFGAWLLASLAAMALVLAAIGLAASNAWAVAQRTREIGVRMALGADPARVTRAIVVQGLVTASAGVALGLAAAAATTRLLSSWLYGVTPLDPSTFAACAAGMMVIALAASYLPSRRAARIDPLIALRSE